MLIPIHFLIQDMELNLILIQFFSIPNFDWGKNIILKVDMSSSVDANDKNKNILIPGKEKTKGLDNTLLTAEAEYLLIY